MCMKFISSGATLSSGYGVMQASFAGVLAVKLRENNSMDTMLKPPVLSTKDIRSKARGKNREEHLLATLLERYRGKVLGEPAESLFFETEVLPLGMVDKSTSPLQTHFGSVFGDESVQTSLLFPE
jgi:hypothetical protein